VCISKRPTDSLIVAAQQWGRVLRPVYADGYDLGTREGRLAAIAASDKPYAIILDHAGNVGINRGTFLEVRHGFPQDDREWSLTTVHRKRTKKEQAEASEKIRVCLKCSVPQDPAPACYNCGEPFGVKSRVIQVVDGKLAEVDPFENERKVQEARNARQEVGKARTKEELQRIANQRGYAKGWIFHQMKIKGIKS
jgi:superfamily II DNA or RNA helicase